MNNTRLYLTIIYLRELNNLFNMKSLNEYITVDESRQGSLRPTSKDELK